jgi:hypothetical protein
MKPPPATRARSARRALSVLLALFILCVASVASAHKPSDSYVTLEANGTVVNSRWDIALRDLDYTLGLDRDGDGAITWGEVRAREADIDAYAIPRLAVSVDGEPCAPSVR